MNLKQNLPLKIAILGGSRGLGLSLTQLLAQNAEISLFVASRKVEQLKGSMRPQDICCAADFTTNSGQELVLAELSSFRPQKIFYVAGGGPFGAFASKKWADHQWALDVTFNFPARLLHWLLPQEWPQQIVFVGSQIAENKADPGAASYAAAKHALRGLITSVQAEQLKDTNPKDLRLFSAPYMDTTLLPANAWPRQQGLAQDPNAIALQLWQWSQSPLV